MGGVLLRTDQIRREVPGSAGLDAGAGYRRGLYAGPRVHETYREMLSRARSPLERGESVVLGASWSDAHERESARAVAHLGLSGLTELCCVAPTAITEARMAARTGDPSDATADIAAATRGSFAPWSEADLVDTAGRPETAVEQAWRIVGG
ncbi:hypothetical protein GCM10025787_09500 [Saccharopolyspora rosea]